MIYQPKKYIITGPPGSGKTCLIEELQRKEYPCIEESSRKFIIDEIARGGERLPWKDVEAFDKAILHDRIHLYQKTSASITFFDRGIPDSLAYLELAGIKPDYEFTSAAHIYRYQPEVFFFPSWREIYKTDEARKEPFEKALQIEESLKGVYGDLGYKLIIMPKISVMERVSIIESIVKKGGG